MPYLDDYRQYITEEYERRLSKNSSYSMRAFARDLQISAPSLNMILSGKTGLSPKVASQISQKICAENEREYFVKLVSAAHSRSRSARLAAKKWIEKLKFEHQGRELNAHEFSLISDWYYIALIHLLEIKKEKISILQISNQLGISKETVQLAIEKLTGLGLVRQRADGQYVVTAKLRKYNSMDKSADLKKYYSQMLAKADESLELGQASRTFSVSVISVSKDNFEYVKSEIDAFRKKMSSYLAENSQSPDSVYALSLQFFPVIKELP